MFPSVCVSVGFRPPEALRAASVLKPENSSGVASEFMTVWLSGPASKESLRNLNKSSPAGLGRQPPKFVLFRGDSNGQTLKVALIPVRFTESQQRQSPVTCPDPFYPLSPQGSATDTPFSAVSEFIITFKKWKCISAASGRPFWTGGTTSRSSVALQRKRISDSF